MNKFPKIVKALQLSVFLILSILFMQNSIYGQSVLNTGLIPTGSFSGKVIMDQQSIHSGIYIYVEGTSFVGVTDANGNYVISNVPYGTYTLTAQKENYTIVKLDNQKIESAGTVVPVNNITLYPTESAEQLFTNAVRKSTKGYDDAAIVDFQNIINNFPGTELAIESEYRIAFIHYTEDKFTTVKTEFENFLASYPSNPLVPLVRYWLGKTKIALEDYSGAISTLELMVSQDSTHQKAPEARYNIARTYEKLSNNSAAINEYKKLINSYPSHRRAADAQYNIGAIYLADENYNTAIVEFQK
ncbi:hypothetical protein MNBD_IGNAVI01-745, partial [hydrothermal vent metagenome]